MASEIKLPELGENLQEGEVLDVRVAPKAPPGPRPAAAAPPTDKLVPAGPATRRLARELGVDLRQVRGSARGGRVTQEDVRAFVRELASGAGVRGAALQAP